jgi:diphosphomevalonate decarboxylase
MKAKARARANIALVKYWGKADSRLNIPAVGSISITLDALWTDTEVDFDPALTADTLILGGGVRPEQLARVSSCLDLLRERAGVHGFARVSSENNFPTGAGLASSASGFAALVAAAADALRLELSPRALSAIARQGSGSAARSLFGGYVEMHAGTASDGADSCAEPLLPASAWPLEVVIAIAERGEKAVGSRAGMQRSADSSPYYPAWVAGSASDLATAREAILGQDFEALADVSEHSCLKMHAAAMAARPPLMYWKPATLECLQTIQALRRSGLAVFFTIDAGPQVKAVCEPPDRPRVAEALRTLPGVLDVTVSGLGAGPERL